MATLVTEEHVKQFDEHGYFVLLSVMPPDHIHLMNDIIQRAIAKRDQEMKSPGTDEDGLILCSKVGKYFFFMHEEQEVAMKKIIFSQYMEQIVRAILGRTSYFTFSGIVVKRGEAEQGGNNNNQTAFDWHQDSGYVPYNHVPYLTCWCALTDMTEETGTVEILPMDRNPPEDDKHRIRFTANARPDAAKGRPAYDHGKKDQSQADLRGYFGCDPGVKILCPAGSIVVFSSLTLHCSSTNRSGALRSALNVQYASTPLMSEDGQSFRHKADPFVVERETVEDVKQWQK